MTATRTKAAATRNGEAAQKPPEKVRVLELDVRTIKVPIVGIGTLLVNKMPDETVQKMVDKQAGAAQVREPKDAEKCFRASCHLMPGSTWADKRPRFGFPAIGFKAAMVEAANDMQIKMTEAKRWFHVLGDDDSDLVELQFKEMRHSVMAAPNTNGGTDIRHRGEFVGWTATLIIRYNAAAISAEQVVNILNAAGFGVGVGAYRIKGKKSTGPHGGFEVVKK